MNLTTTLFKSEPEIPIPTISILWISFINKLHSSSTQNLTPYILVSVFCCSFLCRLRERPLRGILLLLGLRRVCRSLQNFLGQREREREKKDKTSMVRDHSLMTLAFFSQFLPPPPSCQPIISFCLTPPLPPKLRSAL